MTSQDQQRLKTTTLILSPIHECKCGTRIDVSRYEPLQDLTCPSCSAPFVVQGQLDRFVLVGLEGHGGTGTVYRAFDPQLGRQIALKVVREDRSTDEEVLAQLESEAAITASLNHPHVLRVFSVGRGQGRFYIAMELVQGGSLDDLLTKHKVLPEAQALEVAIQVASGLEAAQQAGLVHRDVKPGNVLFSNAQTAKVVDFGLAMFERQATVSTGGTVWGTPFYMSPERLESVPEDFRSDIYSLGTVLFQMLTGRPPFDAGTPQEVAMKRLSHPAPSVLTYAPKISNATAFVVKKMLERDREQRFQNYPELIDSLQFARAELGQSGKGQTRVVLDESGQRRTSAWITLAFAAFFIISAIVGVVMIRKARAKDEVSPIPVMDAPVSKVVATPVNKPSTSIATVSGDASKAGILPGLYILRNRRTNQALDVYSWNSNRDAKIHTWPGGAGLNQRWILRPSGAGWQLVAMHSCKALEVFGDLQSDGAAIRQGVLGTASNQIWRVEPADAGYHRIIADRSGKALTVLDATLPSGAPVGQRTINQSEEQQWRLEGQGAIPDDLGPILRGESLGNAPAPVLARQGIDPKNTQFLPISLADVANCDSRTGNFSNPTFTKDTVRPRITGWVEAGGATFDVLDVTTAKRGKDLLILKGGLGQAKEKYPKKVEIPMKGERLTKLHFLSGVGGWGYPWEQPDKHLGVLAARITVVRKGGAKQEFIMRNGVEFADYHARHDVPGSAYVIDLADYGRQIRYLNRPLQGSDPVEKLIIESFETNIAPVFLAITAEVAK
jgi:serine/threonine protein kinase